MNDTLIARLAEQITRRKDSAGGMLYNFLAEAIIQGELRPGTALSEADLARRLEVSRQLVREAFIKLAERKLLMILPQRGSFVVKISPARVLEARWVRETIETRIAGEAARAADAALVARLREIVERQRRVPLGELRQFQALDDEFHQAIAYAVDRAYAWEIIEQSKAQMDRVRFLSLEEETSFELLAGQHTLIVDAIEAGDVTAAEAAISAHLRMLQKTLPAIVQAHPDLFENGSAR